MVQHRDEGLNMVRILPWLCGLCLLSSTLFAAQDERTAPESYTVEDYSVRFNGGYLKAQCLYLDVRTEKEKERDIREKKLAGSVILFLHGHSQRPGNGFNFTSKLALKSKSGIIVIPICDTPYGRDPKWRGDDGKDIILMEVTKRVLEQHGLLLDSYRQISDMKADIKTCNEKSGKQQTAPSQIPVKLLAVGWSHGGILARRLASRYPETITDLAHATPAGYEIWGNNSATRACCLMGAFNWESMRIGTGFFRGEGRRVLDAGWGVAKGMTGDTVRSCGSCIYGNFHPLMPFRTFRDAHDCALYINDAAFPVPRLNNIVVLFGINDSLFEYRNAGLIDAKSPSLSETNWFRDTYYRSAYQNGSQITVKVLPGNHIAPLVHADNYTEEILVNTGQLRGSADTAN